MKLPQNFSPRRFAARHDVAMLACVLALVGCANSGGGGLVGKTLETVGLKAPESVGEARALASVPRKVTLRVHAGDQLNVDQQMRSLSVVVRMYRLRRLESFMTVPYGDFGNATAEKDKFGDDLIDVRELVMRPGQKHEATETLGADTSYIAFVALFRAPAEGRWRFAFNAKQAEKTGVTLGLHGCAISVAAGVPERAPPDALRVAGVQCR